MAKQKMGVVCHTLGVVVGVTQMETVGVIHGDSPREVEKDDNVLG